ncbi:hypothetical protein [Okeania sp. SIO2G5]|nr:hypothetical protein [Okeania sp. SIO2G5]
MLTLRLAIAQWKVNGGTPTPRKLTNFEKLLVAKGTPSLIYLSYP